MALVTRFDRGGSAAVPGAVRTVLAPKIPLVGPGSAPRPVPQSSREWQSVIGSVLGPPRPPTPTKDQIWSDIWVQPYRGPIEMDPWSLETPAMRAGFRTQYRTSPVARAAIRGKANDICVLEPTVLPADRDDPVSNLAAEFVKWTIDRSPRGFHGLIDSIYTTGSIDGFSLCEKTLKLQTWKGRTLWGLDQVRNLDTGWLRLELDQFRNVLAVVNMIRGMEYYSPDQIILYSHNPQYSNPFGQSDMRAATRAAALIEDAYKLWYVVLQLQGEPYLLGKTTPVNQAVMAEALEQLRQGGYTVTGPEDSIEVLQLANAAASGTFKDFLQTQREDIFFAVRGVAQPFMEGDGGSDAHTDTAVQQGTSDAGERFAALEVASVINTQLIPWLCSPNFTELRDDPSRMPRVKLGGTDWQQNKTILDIIKGAKEAGLDPSAEWAYAVLTIPPARDEKDKLKDAAPQPGGLGGKPPGGGDAPGAAAAPEPEDEPKKGEPKALPQAKPEPTPSIPEVMAPSQPATFSAAHEPALDAAMVARAVDALIAEFTGAA